MDLIAIHKVQYGIEDGKRLIANPGEAFTVSKEDGEKLIAMKAAAKAESAVPAKRSVNINDQDPLAEKKDSTRRAHAKGSKLGLKGKKAQPVEETVEETEEETVETEGDDIP